MKLKSVFIVLLLSCFVSFNSCSSLNLGKSGTETVSGEPKGDSKDQGFLKKINATVSDMKKHVSVDTGCPVNKIVLLELSEQKGNAIYVVDVCGTKMKYRRTGSVFFKDGENPLNM